MPKVHLPDNRRFQRYQTLPKAYLPDNRRFRRYREYITDKFILTGKQGGSVSNFFYFCIQIVYFILLVSVYFFFIHKMFIYNVSQQMFIFANKLISDIFQCPKCTYQTTEGSSGTRHCPKCTYQTTEGSVGTESLF